MIRRRKRRWKSRRFDELFIRSHSIGRVKRTRQGGRPRLYGMGPTLENGAQHYGPFDRATLWERVNEDMDLLRDLLQIFSQEYPAILQKLGAAVKSRSSAEIAKYGHKLKGSALQFSAMGAASTAARLEKMGETGTLDGADKLYEQLKSEFMELAEALRLMTRNGAPS